MKNSIINAVDSYKLWNYQPPGTALVNSYIESRGGEYADVVFFGLQAFILKYLNDPVEISEVIEMRDIAEKHGVPFNFKGWEYIVNMYDGWLPVEIEALPEGSVVPVGNVLVQIRNTDPNAFWLTSYLETAILRAIWYPCTVATKSYYVRQCLEKYMAETADDDDFERTAFKLHDFGARGASSGETAALGGMAHLLSFFGTDTIESVVVAKRYYGESMAGFSIPASEHSTSTAWNGPYKASKMEGKFYDD